MKNLKTLVGERIFLADLPDSEATYIKYCTMLNSKRVLKGTGSEPTTPDGVKRFICSWRNNPKNMTWGIFRKSDSELIGDVTLRYGYEEYDNDGPETAIMVGEDFGKGIGYEAMRLLLDYAFSSTKLFGTELNEVNLSVYKDNAAAVGLYRKLGFEVVGEGVDKENGRPEYIMKITRDK